MTDKQNSIHLIITGGTIDSVFDGRKDAVIVNDHSVIPGYLQNIIQPHFKLTSEVLTMKDSRQITDHTRADMVAAILRAPSEGLVITHGTYTMAETAIYLGKKASEFPNTTIILTGAFFPLRNFAEGDAGFNLGFAIAAASLAKPGVYLAMNSELFSAGTTFKDLEKGRFERL